MSTQPPQEPPEGWGPPGGQQPPPEGAPGGAQGQEWGPAPRAAGSVWVTAGPATRMGTIGASDGHTAAPQKRSKGRTFAIGCLSIVALFVVIGIATALFGGGSDE